MSIIQNALRVPMKTIASNAGVEGAVIVGKVGAVGWGGGRNTHDTPFTPSMQHDGLEGVEGAVIVGKVGAVGWGGGRKTHDTPSTPGMQHDGVEGVEGAVTVGNVGASGCGREEEGRKQHCGRQRTR